MKRSKIILTHILVTIIPLFFAAQAGYAYSEHWSAPYLDLLAKDGYVLGNEDGDYNVDGYISVAEFITILVRIEKLDIKGGGEFWYSGYVQAAIESGILENDQFEDYKAPIARGDIARILINALDLGTGIEDASLYQAQIKDFMDIDDNYKEAILLCYMNGIIVGSDGIIRADDFLKRGEAFAVFCRTIYPGMRIDTAPGQRQRYDVAYTKTAEICDQIITVTTDSPSGINAEINAYEKTDGRWELIHSARGVVGSNGISYNRHEGDRTTPGGSFTITLAFGNADDPGVLLPYRRIESDDYWVGDSSSDDYNTWQKYTPESTWSRALSEHLAIYQISYKYAMAVDFNLERTKYFGSAVFFHVLTSTSGTAGCVALQEGDLLDFMRWADPGKNVHIIICPQSDLLDF